MKKIIAFVLVALTLVGLLAVPALADGTETTNWAYDFMAQCLNTTDLSHAGQFHTKENASKNYIEVRSNTPDSYKYTNLIYAYVNNTGYYGGKWHAPDGIYYTCSSDSLKVRGLVVTPGGRGNTKYLEQFGLAAYIIEGQFRTH